MSNPTSVVTERRLGAFYQEILPYLGGIVSSKAGFTPIGTIISVMGTTAPTNYLACDGTVYNIADYTELANYFNEQFGSKNFFGGDGTTTFAVPDLRGEFLRGTGTNSHSGQGSGASVGVHQDGTEFPNTYSYNSTSQKTIGIAGFGNTGSSLIIREADVENITSGTNIYANGTLQLTDVAKMITSRPTNTSVLYCIATKNFYIDPTLDYSTEEKIVGTWIDGKPLYQRTVHLTNVSLPSANQYTDIDVLTDTTCKLKSYTGILMDSNYDTSCLPVNSMDRAHGTIYWTGEVVQRNGTGKITIKFVNYSSSIMTWSDAYITLQYTKTTDG